MAQRSSAYLRTVLLGCVLLWVWVGSPPASGQGGGSSAKGRREISFERGMVEIQGEGRVTGYLPEERGIDVLPSFNLFASRRVQLGLGMGWWREWGSKRDIGEAFFLVGRVMYSFVDKGKVLPYVYAYGGISRVRGPVRMRRWRSGKVLGVGFGIRYVMEKNVALSYGYGLTRRPGRRGSVSVHGPYVGMSRFFE